MVELKEIARDNYEECLRLRVAAGQRAFVSSTEHSLAQAWVFRETAYPFAIYSGGVMVGFIMLGYYELKSQYTLWKFMIDERYQRRGYGRAALRLGLDFLVRRFNAREIYTAYEATNRVARELYASFGFRETGAVAGNEVEMKLTLACDSQSAARRACQAHSARV